MRKAGTKTITKEMMVKTWKLHNKHVDNHLIAEALGISHNTASRIVKIMTTAQNGSDIDALYCGQYKAQKRFAKEILGIKEENSAEIQEEKKDENREDDNLREFMVRVLFALSYQNQLLEKLCAELGVKTEGE